MRMRRWGVYYVGKVMRVMARTRFGVSKENATSANGKTGEQNSTRAESG